MENPFTDEYWLQAASDNLKSFENVLSQSAPFEIKGILNSEMLLFTTLIKQLNVDHVIESGRARAQSTEIIARYLSEQRKNVRFDSIEFDNSSADVAVAEERIAKSGCPVNFLYGDAFEVLPRLLQADSGKTIILIDGPKGVDALALAVEAMKHEYVAAVCIHDMHLDAVQLRAHIDEVWPENFSSDNKVFVEKFQEIDAPCWAAHQQYDQFVGWGPYRRGSREMKSYGPTLLCMFNPTDRSGYEGALLSFQKQRQNALLRRSVLSMIGSMLPNAVKKNEIVRKVVSKLGV